MSGPKNNGLQNAKNKRVIYLFFATFFFSMFIVGFIIKTLSPSVDVEIGDNVENSQEVESPDEPQSGIDDRLKWIQFEDNMPGVSKRIEEKEVSSDDPSMQGDDITNSADEKVRDAKNSSQTDSKTLQNSKSQKMAPPVPTTTEAVRNVNASSAPLKMTKVYIGSYSSIEQAISVQNKLIDANLNVSPFVKEVNGYYVVQVGSYANRQKAQTLYSEVTSMGFPAKMTVE